MLLFSWAALDVGPRVAVDAVLAPFPPGRQRSAGEVAGLALSAARLRRSQRGTTRRNNASEEESSGLATASAGTSGGKVVPSDSEFSVPPCTCDCCQVTRRRPDEVNDQSGAFLKCALNEPIPGDDTVQAIYDQSTQTGKLVSTACPSSGQFRGGKCTLEVGVNMDPGAGTDVLAATTESGTDYNRFCFFQCQPFDFQIGHFCVPFNPSEASAASTKHGNGQDPGLHPQTGAIPAVTAQSPCPGPAPAPISGGAFSPGPALFAPAPVQA